MNDRILYAHSLKAKVLISTRRVRKFEERPMRWIPRRKYLVDGLLADRLTKDGRTPKDFRANARQQSFQHRHVFSIVVTIRIACVFGVTIEVEHQYGLVSPAVCDCLDWRGVIAVVVATHSGTRNHGIGRSDDDAGDAIDHRERIR